MELKGKISKIDHEMGYGFVKCPKFEEVFFSEKSLSENIKLSDLKVNDSVHVFVKETERGLFAELLATDLSKKSERIIDANL
jgi:cold shock CspA family protein